MSLASSLISRNGSAKPLDGPLILALVEHLEKQRENSANTRNPRFAAINAFFGDSEYRVASFVVQSRGIHAIPMKKSDQAPFSYRSRGEPQAPFDAPDASTAPGIRDRAVLHRGALVV